MSEVLIGSVDDYDALQDIGSFVSRVIDAHPPVAALLAARSAERLVVVKPNWIQESHEYQPDTWEPVITHPVVVAEVCRVLAKRMGGVGTLSICDAPHTYADFEAILARGELRLRLEALRDEFPSLQVEIIDLRRETWVRKEEVVVERRPSPDDPRGYARLDLSRDSHFYRHEGEGRYYGADYDTSVVNEHHRGEVQEYLLAGTPMACDLFVNLPKLKTHKKTGITCSLKNLVGINGDKNWLPHHTEGHAGDGGDEFPTLSAGARLEQIGKRLGRRMALAVPGLGSWIYRKARNVGKEILGDSTEVVRNGNWHGNDTCWRMALDLNRSLLYGNPDGSWRAAGGAKRYLSIVDGVIGGEGNGPLEPQPVRSRVMIGGGSPAEVDAVAAALMGFRPESLPIVRHAFDVHRWPLAVTALDDLIVIDERAGARVPLRQIQPAVPGGFKPHFGWTNLMHEELAPT